MSPRRYTEEIKREGLEMALGLFLGTRPDTTTQFERGFPGNSCPGPKYVWLNNDTD
jgi:hypothetical protein